MYASNQCRTARPGGHLAKTWFPVCDVKGGLRGAKCVSYHGSRYTNVSFLLHTSPRLGVYLGSGRGRPGMREGGSVALRAVGGLEAVDDDDCCGRIGSLAEIFGASWTVSCPSKEHLEAEAEAEAEARALLCKFWRSPTRLSPTLATHKDKHKSANGTSFKISPH
jgi:hypothetical protein